ncbi:related to multidrug resistance protein [Cephalotrichum gorgonifer]|uniref:Related to multidrug resistance protein n=1 Tax=Cephalotrichum gorgonifer TaxID=2041049 RepID=A0AAE8MP62_9PEZI|nr:related to multidrug resistance protein [Cephalotrichum gorgonifer]
MSEKETSGSEKPGASRESPPAGTAESESTAVPMPAQEETASAAKARPEREPTPKDLLRVFFYAKKWDVVAYIIGSITSMAAGVTLPLLMVLMGQLVDKFQKFFLPNTTVTRAEFEHEVNRLSLFMFGLFLARLGCNYVNKVVFRMVGIRMSSAIRADFLRALFAQSIHVLDSMPAGAAASTITTTANVLQNGISEKFGVLIEFLTTMIAGIIIAFIYSWSLALVTFSVILFIMLTLGILLPLIVKGVNKTSKAEGKATAIASEALSSIRMIAACGAQERTHFRYLYWSEEARRLGQRTSPLIALQLSLVFFAMWAAFGLSFWYGTKSFLEGRLDGVGEIVIILMSCMVVVMSLERVSTPILAMSKATVAACQFFTVIDAPSPPKGHLKGPEVSATDDINFENVTFAYPGRPHVKVLDDLSLTIEAGKLTAIVGPSGSGKSTIVGLIQRWYSLNQQYVIERAIDQEELERRKKKKEKEKKRAKKGTTATAASEDSSDDEAEPQNREEEDTGPAVELKGRINCGKTPVDDIDATWWRTQIGLVQQEPFLFNDTIYKNVAYGLIGSQWENESEEKKRELVKEACQEAFADEFIDRLPQGYDTHVGESGAKLSGGQRQRIAIARSIVRKPTILILDEATSAIDVRGEKIVQAALDRVAQNRTTITIAHRLSTIMKADKIVVLKKGRVVEIGTHQSLLEDPAGVYSGLVGAQKLNLGEGPVDSDGDGEYEKMEAVLSRQKSAAGTEAEDATAKPESAKVRSFAKSFGRLMIEQRSRWPYYILTIFFSACVGASTSLMAYVFAQTIVVFNLAGDPKKMQSEGNFWSLMWVMLAIFVGGSYFFVGWISTHVSYYVSSAYRNEYFKAILFQKLPFFDQEENSQGTLTSRVSGDPRLMEEMSGINMAFVYSSIFGLVGALIISLYYGWKLALVATFVTMPIMVVSGFFRLKYELEFNKMNDAVFEESSKFAAETIGAFRTVSSLTLEDTIATRYEDLLAGHVNSAFRKALQTSLVFAFSDSSSIGCQALIFWYGGRLLASREYGPLAFFVIMMAVVQGAEGAGQGLSMGPNAAQAAAASNRILDMRESQNNDKVAEGEEIPDVEGGVKIELQDLHFKYPTRETPVFRGLNLTIEKGQFAALVGASGCGKTSIVSLLERFYDPYGGRILANGKDIQKVNVYTWRKYLSLVAQEPTLFQGTIRENILLGVDADSVSEERLHAVCRDASIHDFIVSLPDGYNTNIGSKGVSLSGGQKQRVAIARALIRDPNVLLLDEATSSLDSESERLVQAAFERAGKGRTMVVVAHRLATVQNADVIFVLGEGKLLEQGSHAELLKKKGVYWNMCQSQALDR